MSKPLTSELLLRRLADLPMPDDVSWQRGEFDYPAALGVSSGDAPELLRIAGLWALSGDECLDEGGVHAPIHAWRTLGQLAAVDAVSGLLDVMKDLDALGDDWHPEEFPDVFRLMGPAVIESLSSYIANSRGNESCRSLIVEALSGIAADHPESRDAIVGAYTKQLSLYEPQAYWLNASLAGALTKLKAVEAAETIEHACAACVIDEGIYGGWEYFREQLGVEGLGLAQTGEPYNSIRQFQHNYRQAVMEARRVDSRRSLKKRKILLRSKRKSQRQSRRRNRRVR